MKRVLPLITLSLFACSPKGETADEPCVPTSGTICTVVGTEILALAGDGAKASAASLYWPMDMTIGPDGNWYIVDWNNHRIRKVD